MSDFKVIKCKVCNAPLVELNNQKLTECVQCGYKFPVLNKNKNQLRSEVAKSIRDVAGTKQKSIVATIIKWYFIIAFLIGILFGIFNL